MNRGKRPEPEEVVALRAKLQTVPSQGITAAQDRCAELMYTSRRTWQQWERGERKMHPAFWELANTKIEAEVSKMRSGL